MNGTETEKTDQTISTPVIPPPLDNLKIKLSVQLLAAYLKRGYPQAEIARICNISRQAVDDYISRHYDDLAPLVASDGYLALKVRNVAEKAANKIHECLDDCTKKDLIALNAIMGTGIEKYRLLSGQSTQIVDYHDATAKMSALDAEIARLKRELGMSEDIIDITPIPDAKVEGDTDNQVQTGASND